MAFFATNPYIAENWLNPKTRGVKPTIPGAGPLSSTPNINPYQMMPQAVQQQTNWGAPATSTMSGTGGLSSTPMWQGFPTQGYNSFMPWYRQPGYGYYNPMPQPQPKPRPQPQPVAGGDDAFLGDDGITSGSEMDLRGYLENRGMYQAGLGLFGALTGLPFLGGLADYSAGINPLAGVTGNVFLDSFGEEAGLTPDYFGGVDYGDLSGYQRDFLTEQIMFDEPSLEDQGLLGGIASFFGGDNNISLDYDRDLDLTLGPWEETRPLTLDELAAMGSKIDECFGTTDGAQGWGNNYLDAGFTQEDVDFIESGFNFNNEVTTAPTPGVVHTVAPRDETVVEPTGWAGDISAGGYTWDSDDWGSVEEAQEETGIGTSEWDSSHADFSWDDDDSGGDSGGGDSGGGGSYIATAATQALGEKGLKVFEDWRDYMFTALPTFTTSYGRYRVTAPKIVKVIDSKNNSNNIYTWIWDIHLKPIFDMIKEDKDSKKALKDYKIMVKDLQDKFLKEKV